MSDRPILYSFRRCPYAIRARLALYLSKTEVELREIVLKNKPDSMLHYSPKGTVPVLVVNATERNLDVIDESLDIMHWALAINDPTHLLNKDLDEMKVLIDLNDGEFKHFLDRYKYADRYPEQTEIQYREQAEQFIQRLEARLKDKTHLLGDQLSFADIAILPFIRQFAHVDLKWFEQSPYPQVRRWLNEFKSSELFTAVMKKYPAWQEGDEPTLFKA